MTSEFQPSRRLPPPEAWKHPDKWIDIGTGLALPNIAKFQLETDDRKFVLAADTVLQVKEQLFNDDYDWPFDNNDPETRPDDHHFHYEEEDYAPINHEGNTIPKKFRELPTMIGRMPRQFHNAIHDFTIKPEMPDIEPMKEYIDAYQLAHNAFEALYRTAGSTVEARRKFRTRRRTVAEGRIIPKFETDIIGEEIMLSDFKKSFESYSHAIEVFNTTSNKEIITSEMESIPFHKPDRVIKALGRIVNMQSINYIPLIISQAA